MPTPIDLLISPVSLAILAIFALLVAAERLFPARALPRSPWWYGRTLLAFVGYFLVSSYLPLWWDGWLASWRLFDLTSLAFGWQLLGGVLAYELVFYGWHRCLHGSSVLWRWFHQVHHSAERHDAWGAFWLSPLDMVGFTLVASVALVLVVGISAPAATATILLTAFFSIFVHTNIRTPRWLGYLVTRPESHSYHHERGVHRRNFCDLPVIDALFGTYLNPQGFAGQQGFYDGASLRLATMLAGRDLSRPDVQARLAEVESPARMQS